MRTLLSGERTAATASGYSRWLKLEVQNASGTWKSLSALVGTDYVIGGDFGETRDQPVGSATFRIRRRNASVTLAPLMSSSVLNVDDGGFYAPLLEKGRAIRASSATIPNGTTPGSGDWREGFTGRIDAVAWDRDPIVLECSDLGAWLMDTQIKVDVGQYGTTPVGTAYETIIQSMVSATHSGKLTTAQETLTKQSARTFAVTNWQPGRPKVLEGIRALALNTTADDVRFRYDSAHVSRLTLFDPQRGRSTVDTTFGPTEYLDVTAMRTAIADIRNVGLLPYTDAAGVAHTVTSPASPSTDPSVVAFGERYFELPESDAIVTSAQAQALLDQAVSDLNAGPLDAEYTLRMCWFVQLYDRYTFSANGTHYDQDQTGVVVGYRHSFDGLGKATTTLQVTGKVVGAYADWLRGIKAITVLPPSLDVVVTRGTTTDSISYSGVGGIVYLSIDGGTYSVAPTSPISVTRPASGGVAKEYTFRLSANDQTVWDSVTIQPIGSTSGTDTDTVTPDLVVTPGTVTATAQTYTASAMNPKTTAAVPVLVSVKGTTATDSAGGTYADGAAAAVMTAGATLTVARPAFATVAGATVTIRAVITGGGAETIQRTVMPQVKTVFGPSLDVVTTAGSTTYSIAYVASGSAVELSINGGTYSAAPSSPISVTRPSSGSAPLEYTLRVVADGQTLTDSVTVQPIGGLDTDTVTPDLAVIPTATSATTQSYTASATNPKTAAAVAVNVTCRGCTGTDGTTTFADGVESVLPTGNTLVVTRPAFSTVAGASVTFRAAISGGGTERIQRTVVAQVKTTFGPSLDVVATASTSTYSIAYVGSGGTVELSINGGGYSTAPASPISVTRPSTGGGLVYTFRITADGQTITDQVTVQPVGALTDTNTVTPDLAVVPSAPADTTQVFSATGTNPSGGTGPAIYITMRGTTATAGGTTYADGVRTLISSVGATATVTAARPAFGTAAQASIEFEAVISGGGTERIQRTILNQVKTSFGPDLVVTVTPGSATYAIAYSSSNATVLLSVNGASYGTPGASPISVTRTSSDQTFDFSATLDGVTKTEHVLVPALSTTGGTGSVDFSAISVVVNDYATDTLSVTWNDSHTISSGGHFEVWLGVDRLAPYLVASIASTTYSAVIPAGHDIASLGSIARDYSVYVRAVSSGGINVEGTSGTKTLTVNGND